MSWSAITAAEVKEEFTPAEQAMLTSIAGAVDQLPSILVRTVNSVRGYCLAGGNPVAEAGTIPDQLRPAVIDIARWRWLISLPSSGKQLQTDARKEANHSAEDLLQLIAKGEIKTELPETALDVAAPGNAAEVASADARRVTATKLDGLI